MSRNMTDRSYYRKAKQWLNAFASCQSPLANDKEPIGLDKKACAEIATILTYALSKMEKSKPPCNLKCGENINDYCFRKGGLCEADVV